MADSNLLPNSVVKWAAHTADIRQILAAMSQTCDSVAHEGIHRASTVTIRLDANVLVSVYTARGIYADLLRYILAEHELLIGEVNLLELRRVLKDRFQASVEIIETIEAELHDETIIPKPNPAETFPEPSVTLSSENLF